jgi:hypothetical protein
VLQEIGVENFVFSHADPAAGEEHFDCSADFVDLHPRTPEDIKKLMSPGWTISEVMPMADMVRKLDNLGEKLAKQPHRAHIFLTTTG